jgi:hypothetical protein
VLRSLAGVAIAAGFISCASCASSPQPAPPPPQTPSAPPAEAAIDVESAAGCLEAGATSRQLRRTLAAVGASAADLHIAVAARPGGALAIVTGDQTHLRMTVARTDGTIGLERQYWLEPADCASAGDLLALTLERFLVAFPLWREPRRPVVAAAPPRGPRDFDLALGAAAHGELAPLGGDLALEAILERGLGSGHRVAAAAGARASAPLALGSGQFQQTAVLVGARWRYRRWPWRPRAGLRAGAVLVSGLGFADDRRRWLPWLEAHAGLGRRLGSVRLAGEIAVAPVAHRAVTADGLFSRDLPAIRVGLAVEVPLAVQKK